MFMHKPAVEGTYLSWHQDNGYWRCQPADLVRIWMALDDADTANGCMNVVPGIHLERQPNHSRAQDEGQELPALLSVEVGDSQSVPVPLKAGHAMAHHCLTLHQTHPNRSDQDRRAMVIHYMPVGTRNGEGILLTDNLLLCGHNPHTA
jgi:ectoine hydroxylase-related dioxygenase (phytanoyl-CoA dioxygenase family)